MTVGDAAQEVCDYVGLSFGPSGQCLDAQGDCWTFAGNPTWETDQFWKTGCPTDINQDGAITTADLLEFLTAFGQICQDGSTPGGVWTAYNLGNPYCPADFNEDGSATTADLLEFLTSFGSACDGALGNRNTLTEDRDVKTFATFTLLLQKRLVL